MDRRRRLVKLEEFVFPEKRPKSLLEYVQVLRRPIKLPEKKEEKPPAPPAKPPTPPPKPRERRVEVRGAGTTVVGEGTVEYVTPTGVVEYQPATEYVDVSVEPTETSILVRIEHFIVDEQGRKKTVEEKEIMLERVL